MVIGILQVELRIDDSRSLKDKRRIVRSVKDRLHREHMVSVAEVDLQDNHTTAVLGIALVSNEVKRTQSVLDSIIEKMKQGRGYYMSDHSVEILTGQ